MDTTLIECNIDSLLKQIEGQNADREGLKETPKRVSKMYEEIFSGYNQNPKELFTTFKNEYWDPNNIHKSEMVIVKDIEFYSHCEHHMVPFFGKISVGYIPKEKVIGISKIARVIHVFAKRLQIQERLVHQIADCIEENLDPLGVMVVCTANHLCMRMRGVKNSTAETTTSAYEEFLQQLKHELSFLV
jgi:GTP cyclohydrolase I